MSTTAKKNGGASVMKRVLVYATKFGWLVFPLLLLLVFVSGDRYWQFVAGLVIIYALSALGLDWLMGRAGIVSLGNGALMAAGSFTAAYVSQQVWSSFLLTLVIVAVVGAVLGLIISIPAARLRGIYFALVTLALQFIVVFIGHAYQRTDSAFLGGVPVAKPEIFGVRLETGVSWLLFLTVVIGIVCLLLRNMYVAQPGRMWLAIHENELAARTIGVRSRGWKLAAFVGSSSLITLSGGLLAYYTGRVSADTFTLLFAISFVVMVIVGGMRSIPGVLLGVTAVTIAPLLLGQFARALDSSGGGFAGWLRDNVFYINSGLFGLFVLVVLLFLPRGVVPSLSEWIRSRTLPAKKEELTAEAPYTGAAAISVSEVEATRASGDDVLVIEDLHLSYRNGARALNGVSVAVARGEMLSIVGRNGAGKSSLMRAITGFYAAEGVSVRGKVLVDDANIAGKSPARSAAHGVTLVPEREKVFAALTVGEQLRNVGDPDAARDALPREWEFFERKWNTYAGLLSGGERQLLAIALAASLRPKVLLIDEMSLGLSPVAIERVSLAIRELHESSGAAMIIVEQNVDVAQRLSDRILLMDSGVLYPFRHPGSADVNAPRVVENGMEVES